MATLFLFSTFAGKYTNGNSAAVYCLPSSGFVDGCSFKIPECIC